MRNTYTVVIEGDADINCDALKVYAPSGIDVVFVANDGLAPEDLPIEHDADRISRVVFALDMANMSVELSDVIGARLSFVLKALDTIEPDTDLAIDAIEQMERDLHAAKARIRGVVSCGR